MISFVLAQILSRLIHESNIWSLGHFFIALVKARLLNWLKCLEPIILQILGIIFLNVFRREKASAKRQRSARHTRQEEGAFRHRVVSRASRLLCASFAREMGACIEN